MLSINDCKTLLNKKGIMYNDDEIKIIIQVLYKIAELEFRNDEKIKN